MMMVDPLSATGTAFGIISLAIQACQGLVQFYGSWRDAKSNVVRMTTSTTALVSMLKLPRTVLEEDLLEDNIRTEVERSITNVSVAVKELNVELHKFGEITCRNACKTAFDVREEPC